MFDFTGKSVVITGGASGLGKASAILFARNGARVAILDIDASGGPKAAEEINKAGGIAHFFHCDVTSESDVKNGFMEANNSLGRIDIVHVNTGIIDKVRFLKDMTLEDWNRVLSINLTGAFLTAKYAVEHMLEDGQGGTIVFTGSNWAYVCDPGFSSYAASKGGVVAFARALAQDHAKDNIRINVVCPGNMETPLLVKQLSLEKDPEAVRKSMGKISKPEEVAQLVLFLAGDESSAMIGSAVIIDHGETLRYGP
ncbi:MAG: SDR family oxidoreductase, partial [Spirochaetales bacterium]